jgi:hypothetical protein
MDLTNKCDRRSYSGKTRSPTRFLLLPRIFRQSGLFIKHTEMTHTHTHTHTISSLNLADDIKRVRDL